MTKERPILFSGEMVRAILAGRKTQTRRVVKPQLEMVTFVKEEGPLPAFTGKLCASGIEAVGLNVFNTPGNSGMVNCPYGKPGDRLWVRETWRCFGGREYEYQQSKESVFYRADSEDFEQEQWRPSIFMPRWASRLTLEIVSVRVERVQDISQQDAIAEGVESHPLRLRTICSRRAFQELWESINGKGSWTKNPFVWVIEFKSIKP